MGLVEDLIEAREAYERHDWTSVHRTLSERDASELGADDLTALGTTAFLLGRRDDCVRAYQRAVQAHIDAGDDIAAAHTALWLALLLTSEGDAAVGGGWAARAERMLDADTVERGYVVLCEAFRHVVAGEMVEALEVVPRVVEYARRFADPDLLAFGLVVQGRLTTHTGRVPEGLRLMDEAMVGVMAGDVSPITAGIVYCTMIEGCVWVGDLGRVAEWTSALSRWCDEQPGLVAFTGQCAVHRGQLMRVHGAYDDALEELDRAAERYAAAGGDPAVGLVHQERGDVLRLTGRYDLAERAYDEAHRLGNSAQPGPALLLLDRGRVEEARAATDASLADVADPVGRGRLLPAAVRVHVAAGELDRAEGLAEELAAIAESFGCNPVSAASEEASGRVALARGDTGSAVALLRSAIRRWDDESATHDVARCRVLLGHALRLIGDERTARTEWELARSTFAELGARPAEMDAARLLGDGETPGGLSPRELEVLRCLAAGMTNSQVAEELHVAPKTVARHVSNIFTKLGVGSRTAAAAFAFENDLA